MKIEGFRIFIFLSISCGKENPILTPYKTEIKNKVCSNEEEAGMYDR